LNHLLGQSAAVMASVLWTFCSLCFAAAARRIGALSLNAFRLTLAVGLLGGTHILLLGTLVPSASQSQWFYLALSGIVGLTIGDFAYFAALSYIGPRKGVLLLGQAPIFTLIAAYFILAELPGMWSLIGISVTMAGVFIVLMEKREPIIPGLESLEAEAGGQVDATDGEDEADKENEADENTKGYENRGKNKEMGHENEEEDQDAASITTVACSIPVERPTMDVDERELTSRQKVLGLGLGLIAALGQGVGLVIADLGNKDVDPLSVAFIRILAGCLMGWFIILLTRRLHQVLSRVRDRQGMIYTGAGAFFGPFLGVWSIMFAIANTYTGIAATLSSLAPVFIIPVLWFVFKQRTSWRGFLGAAISVIGVTIIFLL